ncbi:MAG TPA: ArsA-related P-loop ATPase [Accumulibacter sp.]|nr:ArsA-related P-loop ATPase [Accumulibacter sp.]
MTTFDQILPCVTEVLNAHLGTVALLDWLLINRDLNGRVRLIVPETIETEEAIRSQMGVLAKRLAERLGPHAYPAKAAILYEVSRELASQGATSHPLEGFSHVWLVDRLASEGNWAQIAPETQGLRRVVFFSIKGGVGRSTALAATAWTLAQAGKRVLVLDLDLESPGLSSSLLPPERQPTFGITDWLVEDLVDNADEVFESMIATSDLSHDGEIYVAPAHGADPGEYVSKLGRVWMPKARPDGSLECWSSRLQRLLIKLETHVKPDVVLIDSRAGIDEVASTCVTDLGANLVLLFALEGSQTWNGYRVLFEHWRRARVAVDMRERLKVIAALVPEIDRVAYLEGLREHAYEIFVDSLYDEIAPPSTDAIGPAPDNNRRWQVNQIVEGWNFDEADEGAPHYPWPVHWHRSFAGLRSLQGRLAVIDAQEVKAIFGPLIDGINGILDSENVDV